MLKLHRLSSARSVLASGSKTLSALQNGGVRTTEFSTSTSEAGQHGEPSFTKMCEGFFDNARSYVEHRLLTRPDPPGRRPEKYEDKKQRVKGKDHRTLCWLFSLNYLIKCAGKCTFTAKEE